MMVLPGASLDNRLCTACGLIFNAGGTRGWSESFYKDSYSLMMKTADAAIQSFSGPAPISQAERTHQILREMIELPGRGAILEIGAGKGDFLGYFLQQSGDWRAAAFEPSAAFAVLKERFPEASIQRCDYKDFDAGPAKFDLLVALGVLEHVEDPFDMLRWAHRHLGDNGLFYIRVPNFAKNPNDLFCADHLSKLTIHSLTALARAAGFDVVASKEAGVPIFVLLRKNDRPELLTNVVADNRIILDKNVVVAKNAMDAIFRSHEAAKAGGGPFAIFGLGSSGLFAPFYFGFDAAEVAAYLDENRSTWGSDIHGRIVGGLDKIKELGIRHVALAISPVYFEQVKAKLTPYEVQVYSA
ncbi:bifunctional 2-polyprenyl-6-hydroxyphenol methylase/3-demethylubiquinol 3-O-methyltransferase UbiG [Bradyrhizobium jicamae]|uniref:class I SAM-dependent methyltransferase n=1 Tax=Bradyrhizobium jicamae TaxID=280332 RepID=UPI001BA8CAC1|nr:class I SAM-dependent methyltransferase [Bradyrhizobium jicamae]MBR0938033.1 class I SAM-dependent methyltransferase [Bradyrhizobium jicamae]